VARRRFRRIASALGGAVSKAKRASRSASASNTAKRAHSSVGSLDAVERFRAHCREIDLLHAKTRANPAAPAADRHEPNRVQG